MRRMLLLAGLMILGWSGVAAADGNNEEGERWTIFLDARNALLAGDVGELEREYQQYLTTNARTQSGQWKLAIFYSSLNHTIREEPNASTRIKLEKAISTWEARYPKSSGAHIEASHIWIDRAWDARGTGWASTVSDEAWKRFRQDLAKAKRHLAKWKKVSAGDPQWYTYMLVIGKSEEWPLESYLALADEAMRAHPLYYQAYFAALEYFFPKWSGSIDDVDAFARQATDRTKNQLGSEMYARLYWYAACCQFNGNLFSRSKANWPLMKAGFRDLVSRYPDSWNLNNFMKFACMAGDKETTLELKNRTRGQFMSGAWPSVEMQRKCVLWAIGGRSWPEFESSTTHPYWTELAGN